MSVDTARVVREVIDVTPLIKQRLVRPVEACSTGKLSPNQAAILRSLTRQGSQTMASLSRQLMVCRQQMTHLADELERKGYVTRAVSEADRRSVRIRLTEAGMGFVDQMEAETARALYPLFDAYTDEQKAALVHAAQAMKAAMEG